MTKSITYAKGKVTELKQNVCAKGHGYVESDSRETARELSSELTRTVDHTLQTAYEVHKRKR